ncbi:hypothetical protein EZM97_32695 [Dyella soli]|uniref:Uncharacterized protein n=1 Tax=Dyella soli TaxID=522319 RepID=A0A4V2NL47_9GAMM|nr:hypothetical protein [Dyella soli]TCI07348.1 hypothetical protein EZM97_32695 [Dyella soli]
MLTLPTFLAAAPAAPGSGVLEGVRAVLSAGRLDISDIQKRFCVNLQPVPLSRGYAGSFESKKIGCGLPITYVRVDTAPRGSTASGWLSIWFERTACVPGDTLEAAFPGGERTMATDTGATVYGARIGTADVSAIYETETSRFGCVSQLDVRLN